MAKARGATEGESEWLALARASRLVKRSAKIGAYLSDEGKHKLKTAALVEALDQSAILDALVRTHLKGYFAGQRGAKDGETEAVEPDPRVKVAG